MWEVLKGILNAVPALRDFAQWIRTQRIHYLQRRLRRARKRTRKVRRRNKNK